MEIRQANKKDLPGLREIFLEGQKYEKTVNEDLVINEKTEEEINREIRRIFKDPKVAIFVAQENQRLLGYITAMFSPGTSKNGWVGELFVAKTVRRKGIGSQLIEKALNWLRQRGTRAIELTAYKKDKAALSFYRSQQFVKKPSKLINLIKHL